MPIAYFLPKSHVDGVIQDQLRILEDYLSETEKWILNRSAKLNRLTKKGDKIRPRQHSGLFFNMAEHTLWKADIFIPNTFRQSMFLASYAKCERYLRETCDYVFALHQYRTRPDKYSYKRLKGVAKWISYLKRIGNLTIPKSSEKLYTELLDASKLRNCIVHNDGIIRGMKYPKPTAIRNYISKRKQLLSLDAQGRIILKPSFCFSFLHNCQQLFLDLYLYRIDNPKNPQ